MLADAATIGLLFFLGFVGMGMAILSVLRYWLVDNTLESGPALGVLLIILVGTGGVVKSASPLLMIFWILLLIGGSVGVPMVSTWFENAELRESFEDDIKKYKNALAHNVSNAAAWRELGEIYLKLDRYDEAIAAYKEAIRLQPHDVDKIRRRLNSALDYRAEEIAEKSVTCVGCGAQAAPGKPCDNCGAITESGFLEWFLRAQSSREVLAPTAALVAGLVAVLTLFMSWPVALKAFVIALCLGGGVFLLWCAGRSEK
jgi:tetratricopeptide (TPR) repeat protein